MMKLALGRALTAVFMALACASAAVADTFPSKPIRLLVPYAAGGTTDQMARLLGKGMGELLGQTVVIENKPGASGAIAVELTAHSAPDGYTLVFGNTSPITILPAMRPLGYDPIKDLAPISMVARTPLIWAVNASVPAQNMAEFLELAKKQPGGMAFGSTGVGAGSHLAAELLAHKAGLRMVHVPFNGGAPAMVSIRRGDIQAMFVTGLDGLAQVQAGAIRYIGIGTAQRSALIPNLPAIAETLPGFTADVWFGVLAPAGTPAEVRGKLQATIAQVMAQPQIQKAFRDKLAEPGSSTQDAMAKTIRDELAQWIQLIKDANLKLE